MSRRAFGGAFAVIVLTACSSETITLATIPASDASATPTRCTQLADCPTGTYCDRAACGDVAGTCQLFPADCTNELKPVCGCDGISYFNECLRRLNGVTSHTVGECKFENATVCGGPSQKKCPNETFCAVLMGKGPGCPPDAAGECWVIPEICPAPGMTRWDLCGGGAECMGTCEAIRKGGTYKHAGFCP